MTDLRRYLRDAESRPFRYGRHDCFTVPAGWIIACGGPDVSAGRKYTSLRGGLRIAAADGYANHLPYFEAVCDRIERLRARAGDLAVLLDGLMPTIGIVRPGGEDVFFMDRRGAVRAPLTAISYCMRHP